jgi:hypothetical protein
MGIFESSKATAYFKNLSPEDQVRYVYLHTFSGFLLHMLQTELMEKMTALCEGKLPWERIVELTLPHILVPMEIPDASTDPMLYLVPNRAFCGDQFKGSAELLCHQMLLGGHSLHASVRILTDPEISKTPYESFQQMIVVLLGQAQINPDGKVPSVESELFKRFHMLIGLSYQTFKKKFGENVEEAAQRVGRELSNANKGVEQFMIGFGAFCTMRDNPAMVRQAMKRS